MVLSKTVDRTILDINETIIKELISQIFNEIFSLLRSN